VAGDDQATVSFTPASGTVTSYTVTAAPGGVTATASAGPITVTGLPNGVAYTFTVTAYNQTENGVPSVPSNAVTPVGSPGAPAAPVAVAGDGQASVSFSPPSYTGTSPIAYYTVTALPGGRSASGLGSPITVSGLDNGTAYTFAVSATSATGTGVASAPSDPVTPVGLERSHPDPPPTSPRPPLPVVTVPTGPRPPIPAH
jgi:hypothetical protein